MLAEHNGSTGTVLTDYIYYGSHMIAKVSSGGAQYFLSDRLSTRLVLDSSGNVLGRMADLAFGEDFAESGAQEKHHFTSYERDSETEVDYAINRQESVGVGRFMRVDPLSSSAKYDRPQTWNRYSYSANDPVNRKDTTGLEGFEQPNAPMTDRIRAAQGRSRLRSTDIKRWIGAWHSPLLAP